MNPSDLIPPADTMQDITNVNRIVKQIRDATSRGSTSCNPGFFGSARVVHMLKQKGYNVYVDRNPEMLSKTHHISWSHIDHLFPELWN